MRKTILILLFSVSVYNLYSQQDVLLKRFKYRVSNYRAINLNVGGDGQLYNRDFVTGDHNSNSLSGDLGGSFYKIKSTDKVLLNISANAGLNFNSGKAKDATSNNKSRSFFASSQVSVLNKWFREKLFAELGANLSAAGNGYKYTSVSPAAAEKNKQNDYTAAINIGIGKGRLENITDMQNALWLYKTLQEEQRLSRSLTDNELDELGHTITLANNTRVLDFRKKTQFILETTDKFFQQKNVLTANDIRYFTALNDILFFASNSQRLSGTEIYIRLTPAILNASRNEINTSVSTKNENKILNKSVLLSAGINKYLPSNLRHQNNYGFSLRLDYISYHEANKYFLSGSLINQFGLNATIKQAGGSLFFQHAIYPNTRTIISFELQSEAGYQDVDSESGFFGMADLFGSLNYFISYRTRLIGNLGATYQKKIYTYGYYHLLELMPDFIRLYANVGLQVSL